jgi:hypothetical protein
MANEDIGNVGVRGDGSERGLEEWNVIRAALSTVQ